MILHHVQQKHAQIIQQSLMKVLVQQQVVLLIQLLQLVLIFKHAMHMIVK